MQPPPAVTSRPAAPVLRFLEPSSTVRIGVLAPVENHWPKADILSEAGTPYPSDPSYIHRIRIVRTDFKYPLLRLEETVHIDPQSGAETLVAQVAMVADHVLVKITPGLDVGRLAGLVSAKGGTIRSIKPASKLCLVTVANALDPDGLPAAISGLKSEAGVVALAEPDFVTYAIATPNDPSFSQLYGLHNTGQTGGTPDADIDAPEAWEITTGSRAVRVGIIDTGIDYNHPDLAANIWTNPGEIPGNGVDDDHNGYIDDVHGWDFVNNDADPMDDHYHGTHCAGTIGGVGNNGTGVAGVNWQVSLVALKFLSSSGSGTTSDAVEAVSYATLIGVDLTSNSWGGGGYSQALYDAIAEAGAAGHLFIAAAGNSSQNTDASPNYPSGYDLSNIIAVAATDQNDQLASFSNYGAVSVDLAAPGVDILSTSPGSSYRTLSGTSMATPHVAGAAALLLSRQSGLSAPELKAALLDSVDHVPFLSGRVLSQGRLNVASALASLSGLGVSPATGWNATAQMGSPIPPASTTFTLSNHDSSPFEWTATSDVPWATVSLASGNLAPDSTATVTVTLDATAASSLRYGTYEGVITFTNTTAGSVLHRLVHLVLDPLTTPVFSDNFEADSLDPAYWTITGGSNARALVTTGNLPHGGTHHLVMDARSDGTYARNEVTLRLDLTGGSFIRLSFWAKGFNDEPNGPPPSPFIGGADFDGVAISADGVTWYEIQPLRSLSSDWQKFTVDLDAALAAHGLVYTTDFLIRFNQYDNFSAPTDGIAIDDILVERIINKRLGLISPPSLTEGGADTAILTAAPAPETDLVVTLADPSANLVLPASVTLPAGHTSVTFPVSAHDDGLLNGTRSPVITATATGWGGAQSVTLVLDNETAALGLVLPASATEGSTALSGTVTVIPAPDADVVVSLASDDTGELVVPATTLIHAGQTSASFDLLVVDDNRIDGTTTPTITAKVDHWTPASASITIHDNETRTLFVTAPAAVREGAENFTATITLSGTLAAPLTVALSTDDTSELTPPAEVVVLAGQLSATVSVAIVDDDIHDGSQTVRLIATAATFTSGEASLVVQDNDADHLSLSVPPATVLRNQAFSLVLSGEDIADQVVPSYASDLTLSATDSAGAPVPITPATVSASSFASGRWSGAVTAGAYATGVRITVTDTSGRSVISAPFDVIVGPVASFVWSTPPPTVTVDTPFTATVSAVDAVGNPAVSFEGDVALSVQHDNGGSVRILSWIGYADTTPTGEYENTKKAIRSYFTAFIETSTTVTTSTALASLLADKDVFLIPEQENDNSNTMITLGTAWSSVLQDFVARGGTIIVCSVFANEHRILTNSGLMNATKSVASGGANPVTKTSDTWLNEGVTTPFTAFSVSTYYTTSDGLPSLVSLIYPYHVVLSREVGAGRVVLIGTDYSTLGTGMDRIIANAVRAANPGAATMRAPVRPASATFSNGVWSGPLSIPILGSDLSLHADTIGGIKGTSSIFASVAYTPPPAGTGLVITAPTSVAETAGTVTATVSISAADDAPVEITLASGSPAKMTVPASVTISAGATSASFTITILDDTIIDGDRDVVVSATAAGNLAGSATVRVLDDESGAFTLTAPASITENAVGATATITLNSPAARSLTVTLTSSDPTAATVPATVVIPPGYSSVSFPITPVNDTKIDGDQSTVITASVPGWTPATHSLIVTDNDPRTLLLGGASSVEEGTSANVTLSTSGTLATDLVVTLSSSDPAQLTAPVTVTIPAGQTSVTFQVQADDDSLQNGARTIRLTASAATFTDAVRDIGVRDNELHHLAFGTIPDGRSTNVPFAVTITAYSVDGVAITGYTGPATLSAQAANGDPVAFSPVATGTFANGVWTGNLTATTPATGVRITATDGTVSGQSNAFDILRAPEISVSPSSVAVALHRDESTSREVVITNSGQLPLTWTVSGVDASATESLPEASAGPIFAGGPERPKDHDTAPDAAAYEAPRIASGPAIAAPWAPRLETVLAALDAGQGTIRALIPGRYAFSDGVTGTNIPDGGNDMYDSGNYIGTDLGSSIPYSDGVILSSATLGAGGRYFTRKYDGLFVFAADLAGVSYFEITGNLGADGSGSTDTAILTQTRGTTTYRGFVKRVYGAGDPSVNHLVIVADNGSVTHSASTDTNNDQHRVSSLTGITRIYHLLYAGASGSYINNTSAQAVMSAFLDTVSTGEWLGAAPSSGTIAPGASATVTLTFDSTALDFRTYIQTLRVTSNDPLQPTTDCPVSLTVTDRILDHFEFDTIAAQIRGAPFTLRLHALAADGFPVFSYASAVSLAANGATLTPATTTANGWADGVWTGQVTVTAFGTGVTLSANDDAGHTGLSNAFDAGNGPFARFTWDPIPSPQIVDAPFSTILRAVDDGGNPVPAYSGTVALSALLPRPLLTGIASSNQSYPFNGASDAVMREQALYPATTLGSVPRRLSSLALNVTTANAAASFAQWTIRLKNSPRTSLSDGVFDSSGWTTVHVSTATPTAIGWTTFVFSTPFDYDGSSALLVDFSFRNAAPTVSGSINASVSTTPIRAIYHTGTAGADPFAFGTGTTSLFVPLIRFISLEPVPIRPPSANLVNGVWTGAVSLATDSDPAQLRAVSASPAASGYSNTFTASAAVSTPPIPFSETWESGTLSSAWTISGTNSCRTQITTANTPHGGTQHLTLDSSVYGTYSRNEATLTLDLSGRTNVALSFWAKGFNEGADAPTTNPFTNGANFDGVAISADGVTWYEVQPLRSPSLTNAWKQFTVNLDAVLSTYGLAYTSTFRIRFNRYGNDYIPSGGIALDDIAVTTAPVVAPTLSLPGSASESSPPLAGTLSLPASRAGDAVFTLSSSAPAKLALPSTVTLPAGQKSVAFTATPIDDTIFDGSHPIIVTATPPSGSGLFPGTTTLVLTDDETSSLTLSVSPSSVSESASAATATVTLGAAPSARITLALASSDPTAATVPASLTLEAGQTTATFPVTPVNDTKIDGPQTTILSANLSGSTPATASFTVTDNETSNLGLYAYSVTEGSPTTGSVSISGTLSYPLTVTLTSATPAQLSLPSTVTIPAGSTSASFTLTAVDDSNTDGTVSVQITAAATGFTAATANVSVYDNDLHHFIFSSISTPQIGNRAFIFSVNARTIDERSATFSGTIPLSAQNAGGTSFITPDSLTFSNGASYASVSVLSPATGVTLRLDDGAGHSGVSNSFDVGIGALSRFAISPLAAHQTVGTPTAVTVTAQDSYGNTVTTFADSANLMVSPPVIGNGTNPLPYPAGGYNYPTRRTQVVYTPAEVGSAGTLASLALNFVTTPGNALQNWTIRLKHVASLTTAGWESTGWTTVYQGTVNLGSISPGWIDFPFTAPFVYDGVSHLMVDFSYNNSSSNSGRQGYVQTTSCAPTVRLCYCATSGSGDPLLWSGATPDATADSSIPNIRLGRAESVPVTPANTTAFIAGIWTGSVTFDASSSTTTLQARNGGTLGQSNTFDILPSSIISVSPEDTFTINGVRGSDFSTQSRTYTLTNTNDSAIAWSVTTPAAWLSLSLAGGTLSPGASTSVTVTPTAAASTLASGINTADLAFSVNGATNAIRQVQLTITPIGDLEITPVTDFSSTGLAGGPFTPASATWTLSNPGDAPLTWTASNSQSWLSLSSTGGTLAPGATATVTASLSSSATTLPVAVYNDTVSFTNTTTGRGNTSRNATLTIRNPAAPVITAPPTATTTASADNAVLKVTVTSDGTPSYQWYRGTPGDVSAPVSGADGPLLVTPPLTVTTSFWVRITNYVGSTDSATITVTVQPIPGLNLIATGSNTYGQLGNNAQDPRSPPVLLSDGVGQVSTGSYHTAFIKADGTLWTVGENSLGQLGDGTNNNRFAPVQIASNVTQVSAGSYHTLFVRANGTLWAAGSNGNGQLGDGTLINRSTPVQIASDVVCAWAGGAHSLFLKTDGTLWSTGANSSGQLGTGTTTSRSTPVQIATGVAQVAAGYSQTLFVKTNGTLWASGYNYSGQLGDGTTATRTTPVQVGTGVIGVTSGYNHSLFIKSDGTLWAMGSNSYGQLGNSTTITPITPVQIAVNVAKTSAGANHSLFVKTDGTLWATGFNALGQLGDGTYTTRSTPVQVASGVTQVGGGWLHSAFVSRKPAFVTQPASASILPGQTATLNGVVSGPSPFTYQWYAGAGGDVSQPVVGSTGATFTTPALNASATYWVRASNDYGSTDSTAATVIICTPPTITTPPVGTTVASGRNTVLSVTASGGSLSYQWYRGDTSAPVPGAVGDTLLTPPLTSDSSYWVRITNVAGTVDSVVVNVTVLPVASLNLKAMGNNTYGQLGDGTTTNRLTPQQITSDVTDVSAGSSHTLFLKADGTLWATGANTAGQLGDGTTTNRSTPVQVATNVARIAAGSSHSLFVKTNGTLWAMGANGSGQLGDGTTGNRSSPVQIATDVAQVAAGSSHSLFVKTDGTLWSCGSNSRGQLGDGTTTDRHTPVPIASGIACLAAGDAHTFFIKTDATLWAAGYNYYGELCDGTTYNRLSPVQVAVNVAQVSTNYSFSLFVKTNGTLWATGANWYGQLGDGTAVQRTTPVQVATNIAQCSTGQFHSLQVRTDGTLLSTGDNDQGQLGDGTTATRLLPVPIALGAAQASAGLSHSLFLQASPPVLLTQPTSGHVAQGRTTTLTVTADSTTPLTYQWYAGPAGNTSRPVSGAITASFTAPPVITSISYWVRVTNFAGFIDSDAALLTAMPPAPVLDSLPAVTGGNNNTPSWSTVAEATDYEIQADTSPEFADPLDSGWLTGSSHTFSGLTDGQTWHFRVRDRIVTHAEDSWQQTSSAEFSTGIATSVDAIHQSGNVVLAASTGLSLEERFETASTWTATLFPDAYGGTFEINDLSSGQAPDTTPPLPINKNGDQEARLTGYGANALLGNTGANSFADGTIDAYIAPANRNDLHYNGLLLRASRSGGLLNGYGAIVLFFADGTVKADFSRIVDNSVNSTSSWFYSNTTAFSLTDGENIHARFTIKGSLLTLQLWRVAVASDVIVETPIPFHNGTNILTATDTTYTGAGRAGLYSYTSPLSGTHSLFDDVTVTSSAFSYADSGNLISPAITPASLYRWGTLDCLAEQPAGTSLAIDVLANDGSTLLAGGLSAGTDLGTLPALASASSIRLRARLFTTLGTTTPSLGSWGVHWQTTQTNNVESLWSAVVTSIQDNTAPAVIVTSAATSASPSYTLTGTAFDTNGIASLTINGQPASTTNSFASWSRPATLHLGTNYFAALASDSASPANTGSAAFAVTYIPPDLDADGLPDAWETAHGLDPASKTGDNGPMGDPDHDGLSNLLEYACGLDPAHADTRAPATCEVAAHPQTGQNHLLFTYRRLVYPGSLTYSVVTSSDLVTWAQPALAPEVLSTAANSDGLTETVTLRLNPAIATGHLFVRLQVTAP